MDNFEETNRYYVVAGTNAVAIYESKNELDAHLGYFKNAQIFDHHDIIPAEFMAMVRLGDILPANITVPKYMLPGVVYYKNKPFWMRPSRYRN